ncbi:MAG: archaeal proteasome endopeptidase complex subunit beta [Candidatus Bathyarchaeia archaeon]
MSREYPIIPGATTIGLVFKDGVVLASERRVSYGYFVVSKSGKKVFKITDNVGVAYAGIVADMQMLTRESAAYANLYFLERGRRASVRNVAKILSNILFSMRLFPYLAQAIVGGVDEEGPSIYTLDPLGSLLRDDYASVGTGSEIAIGVLEAEYKNDMSAGQAVELVKKATKAATARDVGSGEEMDLLIITNEGSREETLSLR